jgi:hypothetical protein
MWQDSLNATECKPSEQADLQQVAENLSVGKTNFIKSNNTHAMRALAEGNSIPGASAQ